MESKKKIKYYTYELDMTFLNVLAIIIFILVTVLVLMIEKNDSYTISNSGALFILMILWLMLHEIIHGIGFGIFKEVDKKNITFGISLEKGVFYCMCKQQINRKVILTSLIFPFVFIGVITLMIGMMIDSYVLVALSILNIAGAVGDLVMTYFFLKAPKDIKYLDLDDCTSFTVLSDKDLSKIKVKGLKLKTSGIYNNNKMYAKDRRKIVISKASYIVIGGILLLSIGMILLK